MKGGAKFTPFPKYKAAGGLEEITQTSFMLIFLTLNEPCQNTHFWHYVNKPALRFFNAAKLKIYR